MASTGVSAAAAVRTSAALTTYQRPAGVGTPPKVRSFVAELRKGCQMLDIDYVPLRTDRTLDVPLSSYLASRATRVR